MKKSQQSWLKLRQNLYLQIQKQVFNRLYFQDAQLLKYQEAYHKEFRTKWSLASKKKLLQEMKKSQIILVGDFHASQQSQRAFYRLLKLLGPREPIVIALECIRHDQQIVLNQYLNNKIDEKDFLEKVQWQKNWGFPWAHYKVIFEWAKKYDIPVVGLNTSDSNLKKRDRYAADVLARLSRDYKQNRILCLYGDYHLAKEHLPEQISKRLKSSFANPVLRILQNSEKIYFQLASQHKAVVADIVQLSKNSFCLMNVPPWVKWQNYLMYLEHSEDYGLAQGDGEAMDYTDMVNQYIQLICHDLGIKVDSSKLSVYTPQDDFWGTLLEEAQPKEQKILRQLITDEWSFYHPEKQMAFLARPSVNHAASLAMDYVHSELSQRKNNLMAMPDYFLNLIWQQGVMYFGSKLINHSRKTDTIVDIKSALASKIPSDSGREAMLLTLSQKMKEWMILQNRPQVLTAYRPKRLASYREAAKILGGMMGEKLYAGYTQKHLNRSTLSQWLKTPVDHSQFSLFYYEVVEIIDGLPSHFESKTERL